MKMRLLSLLALFAVLTGAVSRAESGPKPIQSYADVLAVIPDEFAPKRASQWTEMKKSMVNVILKENIVDLHTPVKLQATVSQVAHWPDLTLFCEVPNPEGYHIRIFAHFTDDWKARLSMLNIGDPVIIEGTFFKVVFEDLWGGSTLQLCIGNSTFAKEAATSDQSNAAPAVRETTRIVDSAEAIPAPAADHGARGGFTSPAMAMDARTLHPDTAKISLVPGKGVLTFAESKDLSGTDSFDVSQPDLPVRDWWAMVRESLGAKLICDAVYNPGTGRFVTSVPESGCPRPEVAPEQPWPMTIPSAAIKMAPGNSVSFILRTGNNVPPAEAASSDLTSASSSIEPPAAKVIVDSSHGVVMFAGFGQPSEARGFELSEKHWTVKDLSDSVKGAWPTHYSYIFADPVWNDTMGPRPSTGIISWSSDANPSSTTYFEASAIRGATFRAQPGNSVQFVLITDPPSWWVEEWIQLSNTAAP